VHVAIAAFLGNAVDITMRERDGASSSLTVRRPTTSRLERWETDALVPRRFLPMETDRAGRCFEDDMSQGKLEMFLLEGVHVVGLIEQR
jgi:hypothetical protein